MSKRFLVLTLALVLALGFAGTAMAAPGMYGDSTDYYPYNGTGDTPASVFNTTGIDPQSSGAVSPVTADNLINANKTGEGADASNDGGGELGNAAVDSMATTVIKAGSGQLVHGDFKKNTNACASCHQTHTAAGATLLFKNGVYNTCTTCHDGTLGKLNVFDIPEDGGLDTTIGGGTFSNNEAAGNPSMHMPTGFLQLAAAPGGSRDGSGDKWYDTNGDGTVDNDGRLDHDDNSFWSSEFDCVSCHAAHGSYSDRLLHYNPAGTQTEQGNVYTLEQDTVNPNRLIVKDGSGNTITGPWLFYKKYTGKFYESYLYNVADSTPYMASSNTAMALFNFNWGKGIIELKAGKVMPTVTDLRIKIIPGMVVTAAAGYTQGEDGDITKWSGRAVKNGGLNGITSFCAACHADYYIDVAKKDAAAGDTHFGGEYSKAYRHNIHRTPLTGTQFVTDNTGSERMTCLTCHYAHGTTQSLMLNADDTKAAAADVNPSSALKRYTNMSICWKCHVEQHQFDLTQTDGFYNNQDVIDIMTSNGTSTFPIN